MADTYNESTELQGSNLEGEYDESFSDVEKINHLLKLTENDFTKTLKRIKIEDIGLTEPLKKGRFTTVKGLTESVKELGVLVPIHVVELSEDNYILLSGLRRMYAARRNGLLEIDAIVWKFKDNTKSMELALPLTLFLDRQQDRDWAETWSLYQTLESQRYMRPGTLDYLLGLEKGDSSKLKDIMLCEYPEVKDALLMKKKTLDGAYKMLQKLHKEEDAVAIEDNQSIAGDVKPTVAKTRQDLSDEDVRELLEMSEDLDSVTDVSDEDFADMNTPDSEFIDSQEVGNRHPLNPQLRENVLIRDDFTCACCGLKMTGARLGLIAVHHKIPVHVNSKESDKMENLVTLCLNCHVSLHIMERNGGSIMMSKEDFLALPQKDQKSLKRALALARIAIDADKRKGLSKDVIKKKTADAVKHPMPGKGLKENVAAYNASKHQGQQLEVSDDFDEDNDDFE